MKTSFILLFISLICAFPVRSEQAATPAPCEDFDKQSKALFAQAQEAQQKNNYPEAIAQYEKLIALTPPEGCEQASVTLADGLLQLMYCYIFDNRREEGAGYFTRLHEENRLWIVRHSPRDIEICLAYSLYEAARPDKAVAIIDSTLARPDDGRSDDQLYADYAISSVIYNQVGQIGKAIDCNTKSLAILRKMENNPNIVFVLGNLIWQYQQIGEFEKSLAAYDELLRTEVIKDIPYGLCTAEINIVELYNAWGLEDEVETHLARALDAARQSGVPEASLRCFTRTACHALQQGDTLHVPAMLDSIAAYLPEKEQNNYYRQLYDNFRNIYHLQTSRQDTQYLTADARKQLGQLQAAVPDHLNTLALRLLGDALAGRGETALAIEAYRACCDYVEKNKLLNEQRHIYFGLARLYTRTNRYADATTYFERAEEANSLFTLQRNAALISQFRVKYETREKEQANQLLRSEVQLKQRTLEFYTVFGIALILLGGIFALWIVMRHRALKMQHEADNKQHELDLIRQQEAQLIIEEKEHQLRLMLNERQELNRKNEELRDKLEHSDAQSCLQEVINSLSPRLLTLEEEQNFRHQFGIIHPQFLSRLRDICPTITRSEELLAMLIRLKLNTEEIAFALGNNRPSVHSSRSRLRKKMEIDKGISLEEYFRNL